MSIVSIMVLCHPSRFAFIHNFVSIVTLHTMRAKQSSRDNEWNSYCLHAWEKQRRTQMSKHTPNLGSLKWHTLNSLLSFSSFSALPRMWRWIGLNSNGFFCFADEYDFCITTVDTTFFRCDHRDKPTITQINIAAFVCVSSLLLQK